MGASDLEVSLGLANPVNFVLLRYLQNGSNQSGGGCRGCVSFRDGERLLGGKRALLQATNKPDMISDRPGCAAYCRLAGRW